jgi:hypothetical protein
VSVASSGMDGVEREQILVASRDDRNGLVGQYEPHSEPPFAKLLYEKKREESRPTVCLARAKPITKHSQHLPSAEAIIVARRMSRPYTFGYHRVDACVEPN